MLKLRRVRQERGMTLIRLTQLTGIAPSDISLVERERREAFPGWRARISRAMGMPAEELFAREPDDDRG
jgi:transcriptional regulator with XRE-family HTH domain